jgi:hypothetical protein
MSNNIRNLIIVIVLTLVGTIGLIAVIKPFIDSNKSKDDYKKGLLRMYYLTVVMCCLIIFLPHLLLKQVWNTWFTTVRFMSKSSVIIIIITTILFLIAPTIIGLIFPRFLEK